MSVEIKTKVGKFKAFRKKLPATPVTATFTFYT